MERWLPIAALLTLASGVFGYSLLPNTGMTNEPSLIVVVFWFWLMAGVGSVFLLWKTAKLALVREARPIATLCAQLEWKRAGIAFLGCFLLGLNLAFFGIVKPQLGLITPFRADPLLADIDRFIFGTDPWQLLGWFNHPGMSFLYHQGWFLWLAFVLAYLLTLGPSAEKNRALISYFLLWSVFGPAMHFAMPAAGPIFYDHLGLGDRFSALKAPMETRITARYLWQGLTGREFNAGGGISAMPSLHIATMVWSAIVLRKSVWFIFSVAFTLYIFLGSVALGWHYAVDGIAGGIAALIAFTISTPLSQKPIRSAEGCPDRYEGPSHSAHPVLSEGSPSE